MDFNSLVNAPVLCSLSRGEIAGKAIIECSHRGIIAIFDGEGEEIFSSGDVLLPLHTRSTAKPFQLIPLLQEGLKLSDVELALFMSSHSGDKIHTDAVATILSNSGLNKDQLRCGLHQPYSLKAQLELLNKHALATTLHNNCSGKHTAMLLLCKKLGLDSTSYEKFDHEIQHKIRKTLGLFSSEDEQNFGHGIDGCSMPSYCLPLRSLALAYARLGYWQNNEATSYLKDLWQAATTHPEFVAGEGRFDTELMRAGQGQIFCKTGADGMQALALMPDEQFPKGLGMAIKIVDGDHRNVIRPFSIKTILERFNKWPNESKLNAFMPSCTNLKGQKVGSIIPSF